MSGSVNRRQALAKVGGAALAVEAVLALSEAPVDAAAATVRGAWLITPTQGGQPAGLQAISCFAAGGVFITTGSDEPGTGLGQWNSEGANGFAFTYLNFHFGKDGKPSNTVKVRANGTFSGSTLQGRATLTATDSYARPMARRATSPSPDTVSTSRRRNSIPRLTERVGHEHGVMVMTYGANPCTLILVLPTQR